MHVLVGLGNPGARYASTRHNLGFLTVERLAVAAGSTDWQEKRSDPPYAATPWGHDAQGEFWLLVKPLSFMNDSGRAVGKYVRMAKVPLANLWIVHDDVDLPESELREAFGSGSAGHKGVASIIAALSTQDFHRLRIGVGRPEDPHLSTDAFVLESVEATVLDPLVNAAVNYFQTLKANPPERGGQ